MGDGNLSMSSGKPSEVIFYGGCALLIAWFLLLFSGEIWGLAYTNAAESVSLLSLISIASCFIAALALNGPGLRGKVFAKPGGYRFLVLGVLLSLATAGITFGQSLSSVPLVTSCVAVGCTGAFFVCAAVFQLSLLTPRTIMSTSGVAFLLGILIYSFAFYVPGAFTEAILCVLPFLASLFFVFDRRVPSGVSGVLHESTKTATAASITSPEADQPSPSGWRAILLFSIFMLFSCVARAYLPFTIDNETFSFFRSISVIAMLLIMTLVVIVSALLPSRVSLGLVFKIAFLFGVVFFALAPIFGTANAVVLVLADGYRGLCAVLAATFFASMARKRPFFGLGNVSGGLIVFIACGFIGWAVGTMLHHAGLSGDVMRIYDSLQCLLAILAFIALFRQPEIDFFLDSQPGGEAPAGAMSAAASQPGGNAPTGTAPLADSHLGGAVPAETMPAPDEMLSDDPAKGGRRDEGGGWWRTRIINAAKEHGLTSREEEVFVLMAKGYKAQNIADSLVISYNTIRAHIRNIYTKLDVHSQQEFISFVEEALKR